MEIKLPKNDFLAFFFKSDYQNRVMNDFDVVYRAQMQEVPFDEKGYAILATIPNPEKNRRYTIQFECPEWTALCPMSGFPDFGVIRILYEPRESCIELKSLKLYINSYRDKKIFHEAAVNKILTDLVSTVQPWTMEVVGDFHVRGNIKTVIKATHLTAM